MPYTNTAGITSKPDDLCNCGCCGKELELQEVIASPAGYVCEDCDSASFDAFEEHHEHITSSLPEHL